MIEVKEYSYVGDRSPFADWFNDLEATAAAKVAVAVQRMRAGNLSDVKGVGAECWNDAFTGAQAYGSISVEMETP